MLRLRVSSPRLSFLIPVRVCRVSVFCARLSRLGRSVAALPKARNKSDDDVDNDDDDDGGQTKKVLDWKERKEERRLADKELDINRDGNREQWVEEYNEEFET